MDRAVDPTSVATRSSDSAGRAERQIRAFYTDSTVRVYQAYRRSIADPAVASNRLSASPDFKLTRMTWIKPSFCWMAYRAGYSYKDGQEAILAIDLKRDGFDWLLDQAVLAKNQDSSPNGREHGDNSRRPTNGVVVQWDPERGVQLNRLDYRSIQIGLRGQATAAYSDGDIVAEITDVTDLFQQVHRLALIEGKVDEAELLLPRETEYPVKASVRAALRMD